ncbi:hypothetical protein ACSBOB_19600 [Mesorhizobium sp. ASY16-5R]|uniref:hypothetical protein n=1 Tax=Mesorhizobium sp. ASY16-5R TaxID=3445772 RepID=UPI003FA192DA
MDTMTATRETIDLTLIFDPAILWPDPEACPEWPLFENERSRTMNGGQGREHAEKRLASIDVALRRNKPARAPSNAEALAAQKRYFQTGNPPDGRWRVLGFGNLKPANVTSDDADAIVQATHIRGWLRKLDARQAAAAQAEADRKRRDLQRKIDFHADNAEGRKAELASLAEAEARHLQRIEDEKAFFRAFELRRMLQDGHAEAVRAATQLGVEPPAA